MAYASQSASLECQNTNFYEYVDLGTLERSAARLDVAGMALERRLWAELGLARHLPHSAQSCVESVLKGCTCGTSAIVKCFV